MRDVLHQRHVDAVSDLIVAHLRVASFRPPLADESEPRFTGQVLRPIVQASIDGIPVRGFHIQGDGSPSSAYAARLLGRWFYPDIAILYGNTPVFALEVKYLTDAGSNGALATAVGQMGLYRSFAFPRVAGLIVDRGFTGGPADVHSATIALKGLGFDLIHRRVLGGSMLQHPSEQ